MVKPLTFKGDKKSKKRKHKSSHEEPEEPEQNQEGPITSTNPSEEEETWTTADQPSDLSGPIMILLPEEEEAEAKDDLPSKPYCLASDATGAVFALPVENVIPETPARLSAEPSDVRQVWVATKLPGSDDGAGWTLKSHLGRYLSADRFGVVRCEREAAGMEEVFEFRRAVKVEKEEEEGKGKDVREGMLSLVTSRGTFVSVTAAARQVEIRADAKVAGETSRVYVRMQSRFKPQVKASKELKEREKVSRKQLEEAVGRRLDENEVKRLKKARREGGWHEAVLDARVKGRHDKFA